MRTVTDQQRRARLGKRHALTWPAPDVEHAVRAVVCLHATEPASMYMSAFARCGATRTDIDDALYEQRTIVRQLAMRRTVFAFTRDLMPAVRGSAAARVHAQQTARLIKDIEAARISSDGRAWLTRVLAQVYELLLAAPASTATLRATLPDLSRRLPPADTTHPVTDVPIASRVLLVLAADGAVVRGRNDGNWKISRPNWTPITEWLDTDTTVTDETTGYARLVGNWLWSFGPGTEADLVWWLGATKTAVRRALADVGAVQVRLEDQTPAWLHPDDTDSIDEVEPWGALLPALDPTTMGWRNRKFYIGAHTDQVFDRNGNGGTTAWWNGRVVGSWTQQTDGSVTVIPLESLERDSLPPAALAALEHRASELTAWLDGDIIRSNYVAPLVRFTGRTDPDPNRQIPGDVGDRTTL